MFLGVLSYWESAGSAAPVPAVTTGGGGAIYLPTGRRRTDEELRLAREAFGVIPKKVAKALDRVADAHRTEIDERVIAVALHRELDRARVAYRAYYAELLKLEIEQRRQDEEETVLLLLLH